MTENTFYEDGLRFDCARCGECCKRKSGHLFLTAPDLRGLAESLEMSDEDFFLEYCEVVDLRLEKRISLAATEDGGCVFLEDGGCQVYEHRPLQCRTFPFWATNLHDQQAWDEGTLGCRGVNQGELWSAEEIDALLDEREGEPLLGLGD